MARIESFLSQVCKFPPSPEADRMGNTVIPVPEGEGWTDSDLAESEDWIGLDKGVDSVAQSMPNAARSRHTATSACEDSILIKRLSAGDEEALGTLMDRYGGALLHFAHRLVGDLQLAEEIYQDTMLKAWQQAATFRLDGHLKAWLFRVARNNAIDYMRKKRVPTEEYTVCLETAATTFRPEREAERSWLSGQVFEAIGALPPAYREVIELRFFHQLCYQEIADMLEIPLGTVKSRLNYAIQRLTKLLQDRGIDNSLVDN